MKEKKEKRYKNRDKKMFIFIKHPQADVEEDSFLLTPVKIIEESEHQYMFEINNVEGRRLLDKSHFFNKSNLIKKINELAKKEIKAKQSPEVAN